MLQKIYMMNKQIGIKLNRTYGNQKQTEMRLEKILFLKKLNNMRMIKKFSFNLMFKKDFLRINQLKIKRLINNKLKNF